ncbi:hypothetical protein [Sinorhizobium meliloti]|uniref:hypothetical protein n=1 Tax=Rhizobium meliloti TaxID=382 RepID=UPI000FDA295F|nr:hypothetical protein [Sinorhizobium meliloti]RVG59390.1 hypothetical protein CN220_33195 [Sinorhizobium meliloti]RVH42694.1 hypothetical protein CN212_28195 [Sinorhizobium meliloti]
MIVVKNGKKSGVILETALARMDMRAVDRTATFSGELFLINAGACAKDYSIPSEVLRGHPQAAEPFGSGQNALPQAPG